MKTSLITLTAAMLFGGFGGLFLVNGPQDAAPPAAKPAVKFGFVNAFDVQRGYVKQKEATARIQKSLDAALNQLKEREKAYLKQYREELPLFEPGTAECEKLRAKLQVEKYEIKVVSESIKARAQREEFGMIEDFMTDLRKAVADYSKKHGYDAIFLHREVKKIRGQESFNWIRSQWVLYRDEALDLTDEVLTEMNKS